MKKRVFFYIALNINIFFLKSVLFLLVILKAILIVTTRGII